MSKKVKPCPGWLATFADLMSLLMALFVLLFAMSSVDEAKYQALVESLTLAFSHGKDMTQKQQEYFDSVKDPNDLDQKGQTTIENLRPLYESLIETYAQQETQNDINVNYDQDKNEVKVAFAESISFPSGSAELKSNIIFQLRKLKALMHDGLMIKVVGHTDSIPIRGGIYSSNWALSSVRAASVIERILHEGIAMPNQVEAIGVADTQPVSDESTPEGRAQNRRVEIILLPQPSDD